ncbi:Threonine synthase [uncultured archaeon]|nr:Threonine synthase [uncultured archaeon]
MKSAKLECIGCKKEAEYSPDLFSCTSCGNGVETNLLVKDKENDFVEEDYFEARKTPCYKIPELNKALGMENLFIKDETFNTHGTMKDRRSKALVKIAQKHNYRELFCVTAGNLGKSLAEHCSQSNLKCIAVAPSTIPKKLAASLQKKSELLLDEKFYEKNWDSRKVKEKFQSAMDCTGNNPASLLGYKKIAHELLHINPEYIIVPLGTGELFCGICQGVEENGMNAKVIGVSLAGKNPVGQCLNGKETGELKTAKFDKNSDKISGSFTPLMPIIMHFLSKSNKFIEITKEELDEAIYEHQPYFDCHIESSSFSVFAALSHLKTKNKKEKIVAVLTGRNQSNKTITHK